MEYPSGRKCKITTVLSKFSITSLYVSDFAKVHYQTDKLITGC